MLSLLPWIFLTITVALMVVANVMSWPALQEYQGLLSRAMITCLLAGWLTDIWRNRENIRRRIALMVLLGYYIWILITDNFIKMTPKSVAVETAGFLCIMVWAITHPHKERAGRAK